MKEDKSKGYTIQQNNESHCWLFLLATGSVIAKQQDAENVQYALQLYAFLSINPCIYMDIYHAYASSFCVAKDFCFFCPLLPLHYLLDVNEAINALICTSVFPE